jgi:hypothetical protein
MALPTNGRVVIDTTAGEIEIELWSKVRGVSLESPAWLLSVSPGNTKNMPELHRTRARRSGIEFTLKPRRSAHSGVRLL